MSDGFIVTRDEFNEGMQEQVNNIQEVMEAFNTLKKAHNTLAEVCGLHRYILEQFVPAPLLEKAAKEYKAQRTAAIEAEMNVHKPSN
jgi:hypothetical protein